MERFKKAPLTYTQQLELLRSRGLTINDPDEALRFLSHVNYYRLAGYGFLFQKPHDVFVSGTTFEQIVALYRLDEQLRDAVFAVLTTLEIFLRTRMAYELSHHSGAFAHYDLSIYQYEDKGKAWPTQLEEATIERREPFLKHYKEKYNDFPRLPIWIACEVIHLTSLSKFYSCLSSKSKRLICSFAEVDHDVFTSWLHTITFIRNICAHHGRLWSRNISISPWLPENKTEWQSFQFNNQRIYSSITIMEWICRQAELPLDNIELVYEIMRKIAAIDPRFAQWMGVPEGRKIGMCWEAAA
jgi:abortive infection bacteriophage resistance protein